MGVPIELDFFLILIQKGLIGTLVCQYFEYKITRYFLTL